MNELITGQDIVPMDLMQRAIESGADISVWERLMDLHQRFEAGKAHKAYAAAMADAKAEFPPIKKDHVVDFTNRQGQRTYYKFADMATIAEAIDKPLSKHGLTYRFRTVTSAPTVVTVTCIISHRDGYSEENSLSATADLSGNKNPIQAIGSAVTYLQRYTLNAALGLTASVDDDAQTADQGEERSNTMVETSEDRLKRESELAATEPHEVERDDDGERAWSTWATKLYAFIKAASTHQRIDEWIVANSDQFEALKHYDTGKFNRLRHMIQAAQDAKAKATD